MDARKARDPGSILDRDNTIFFTIRINYLQMLICHSALLRSFEDTKKHKIIKLLVN